MYEMSGVGAPGQAGQNRRARFTLSADRGWAQYFQLMLADLWGGAKLWRLCWALGFADIKLRYRGSLLGPFWLTLSTAIMIGSMGFIYADLFHTDIHQYLPYLSVSLILWNYLGALISEGCTCFMQADQMIRGMRMPFTLHAGRSVLRNTIVFGHNLVVLVAVILIMRVPVTWQALWSIPALALWIIDGFALSMILGAFCARFRDVPPIVASLLQVAFFATPVMWYASVLASRPLVGLVIRLNPFYYLLEVVRAPLLGTPLTPAMVAVAVAISAVIVAIAAVGFARARGRIAFWV